MPNPAKPQGLDPAFAAKRLLEDGPNELGVSQKRTLGDMAWDVVREPMFLLLLGAGSIYLAMGDAHEALILLGFVVLIMAITVFQEKRTDLALNALRDLSSPRAVALRGGVAVRIAGRDVVRDDVLMIAEGDRIPADGLLLQAHELATNESMLSGESEPVPKQPDDLVFAGTLAVSGQGLLKVVAVGSKTELGKIGQSLGTISLQASPLREEMARLTKKLVYIGLTLSGLLSGLLWILRDDWLQALLSGITLAMGVLPQELPVIMIVFLALAARRLATQQVLTRRLNAIETLGQTTALCVDKTGTLTQNRMDVAALCVGENELNVQHLGPAELPAAYHELLEFAVLASEIEPHDPMEQAFIRLARIHLVGSEHLHPLWSLAREYELSPKLMAMTHLWRDGASPYDWVACKGAPEAVADLCHLSETQRADVNTQSARLADRGLRVLGVAKSRHEKTQNWPDEQHAFDFSWLGLIALADPLRPEVPSAIAQCRKAGIRVIMITGDHPRTAKAIAAQAGIEHDLVITGDELGAQSFQEIASSIAHINVFARIKPQQKLELVEALKFQGEVVAMTGDGVNDAPALKAAHIGIAMGLRGTDVAREAASLVLMEDNFSAIVHAIYRGRLTFANLRQAMIYTLAVHVPIIGLAILPVVFGLPTVLAPLHIAFLELVIDPACSIVFEAEAGAADLMNSPPRRPDEPLLARKHVWLSLLQGGVVTAVVMGLYAWLYGWFANPGEASTVAFVVMVAANAVLILPSRSSQLGFTGLWTGLTPVTLWVLGGSLLGLAAITTVPWLAAPFKFVALSPTMWISALTAGSALILIFYILKQIIIRSSPLFKK